MQLDWGFKSPRPSHIEISACGTLAYIQLSRGKVAVVDSENVDKVCNYRWYADTNRNTTYAATNIPLANGQGRRRIGLHRVLIRDCEAGFVVDHINHDGLDNRKANLRVVAHLENIRHRSPNAKDPPGTRPGTKRKNSSSAWRGVYSFRGSWRAQLRVPTRGTMYIGQFDLEEDAAMAVNEIVDLLSLADSFLNDHPLNYTEKI